MPRPKNQRNEFAEMYVAGVFADSGWSIYFPRADKGFDFIVTKKLVNGVQLIRPVQVKGKYPEKLDGKREVYGYRGKLTALHDQMVLAMPFFSSIEKLAAPMCIAFIPKNKIQRKQSGAFVCGPAKFADGKCSPRPKFQHFFGEDGLKSIESLNWGAVN